MSATDEACPDLAIANARSMAETFGSIPLRIEDGERRRECQSILPDFQNGKRRLCARAPVGLLRRLAAPHLKGDRS